MEKFLEKELTFVKNSVKLISGKLFEAVQSQAVLIFYREEPGRRAVAVPVRKNQYVLRPSASDLLCGSPVPAEWNAGKDN